MMSSLTTRRIGLFASAVLGALILAFASMSGAQAQYGPAPGLYVSPDVHPSQLPPGRYRQTYDGTYYRPSPQPEYYSRPRYRPQPDYYGEGYYRPRRVVALGNVCVTARGDCAYGRALRVGTVCKCHIPGFGPKRGVIQ